MLQAYQQIVLDEGSLKYVVINTHGDYSSAIDSRSQLHQHLVSFRVMELILNGIPNVVVNLDDILLTGSTHWRKY